MGIKGINGQFGAYQAQLSRQSQASVQRAPDAAAQPQAAAPATAQAAGDRINVSFDGVLRTVALSSAMNAGDVRQEKVDAIRASLDNGTYTIDSRKIATKLVQDEKAIFGR